MRIGEKGSECYSLIVDKMKFPLTLSIDYGIVTKLEGKWINLLMIILKIL